VVIGTDCTGSCQSNYHTITTTTVPNTSLHVSVPDECYSRKAPCLLIHISILIRVITKLPNSEQSSKGKVKTKSVNNRNTGKPVMTLTWYRHFQRNGRLNQILKRQTSRFHFGSKVHFVLISSDSLENTPVNGLYFHWKMSLSFLCSAIGGSCAF
jgi:hypothetical protein